MIVGAVGLFAFSAGVAGAAAGGLFWGVAEASSLSAEAIGTAAAEESASAAEAFSAGWDTVSTAATIGGGLTAAAGAAIYASGALAQSRARSFRAPSSAPWQDRPHVRRVSC